ncbi:autotransporter outer membrane beta-barrel domain-containing protein [Yersinia bercovieri]|uniref:autotransporter outer membrane beta-barrel domain-containing protein n=1 Tax=Yersinia bercovieri TaxID=634 RepID=UPI0011A95CB5|nr:autotransporter outer membrane beta-barrel domain-containing protein [Yersinia bercovieri]
MNQVFKVIWNSALGRYDVASEFSKSGKKTKSFCSGTVGLTSSVAAPARLSQIAMTLILTLGAGSAFAADIDVPVFTPEVDFTQTFTGTGNTLAGSFSNIARGDAGFKNSKLGDIPAGNFLYGAENLISKNIFNLGDTVTETFLDPKGTGALITINVYSSNGMSIKPLSEFVVPISYAVGENGQYVNRNLFHLEDGSDLNVNVGSTAAGWVNNSDNYFSAILKGGLKSDPAVTTSSAFYVESNSVSAQDTVLNYNAKTVVNLGNNSNNIRDSSTSVANAVLDDFTGSFTSPYLGAQNVQNFADFQQYNNDLIAGIKSGAIVLDSKGYQAELSRAYITNGSNTSPKVTPIYIDMGIGPNDAVNHIVDSSRVAFIHGDGQNAIVNIGTDANIQAFNTDISVVRLNDGATLNNAGTLGSVAASVRGTNIIFATDSHVINEATGVLDAGTNPEMLDFKSTPTAVLPLYIASGSHTAILANGSSSVINNGIINTASRGVSSYTRAAIIDGNSIFVNNGAINIAASVDLSPPAGYVNEGVSVQKGSTFENNGTVYVGRQAQRTLTDVVTDLAIKTQSYAVKLVQDTVNLANIATFTNSTTGKIVIGSKTENSIAIDAQGERVAVNQNGTIELNGAGATPGQNAAQNIGISSSVNATNIFNNGDIVINGINSVGIKVLTNSSATNRGHIYVNNGLDPATNLANYGIQAIGVGAVANLSGQVNLMGDGAIGVVAEDKGTINVTGTGQVEFVSGINQVGYLIYGTGSSINNIASGDETVLTEGSTLYRVDKGASFAGTTASTMNATGKDSALIQVTGAGSTFNSGALDMVLLGEGSTGVKVEGGATGTITANASLELRGDGATAGIVDGNYYGLNGLATGATGKSVLTSSAVLSTGNTASGAYGYIARNGGELIHKGTIDFTQAGSTGVLVDGGILTNENLITVNGTAVNIQGADSTVNNSGIVNATDGTAAYLLGAGASLTLSGNGETKAGGTAHGVLLDTDAIALTVDGATITMTAGGSGNAIENRAEIAGIQLKDTTLTVGNGAGVRTGASMAATNSGVINVNGSGTGILFANTGDTLTNNTLDMSDSAGLVINVNSADGKGIVTNSSQNLKTGASVNVNNAAGGAALIVGGTTAQVEQSGNLISESLSSPVVDIDNGFVNSFVNSGTIQANGGNLVLQDQNGNVITDATTADIAQGGTTVAKGTYDYRLTSGVNNDGLYVGYGLTEVELLGSGSDALSLYATNKTGNAADLSARVTGSGDLAIDTGAGSSVSLSNLNNDYTGITEVRSGSLQMLNDNVLGSTSLLSLAADTAFNMNGHSQTVGELSSSAGSSVNLSGGSLTLSQGGVSDGELTGSGEFTIAADTLTVNGANSTLTATTNIASGAQALLNSAVGLGSGNIVNAGLLTLKGAAGQLANAISDAGSVVLEDNSDITLTGDNTLFSGLFDITSGSQLTASQAEHLGTAAVTNDGSLVLNSASDWLLANSITGSGSLTKNGSGTVSLTQTAAYTGQTDINAGGLILGSSADPMTLASQQVNIADGAFMGGFGGVAGAIDNKGVLFVGNPTAPITSLLSRLAPASNIFTVGTDLTNSGTVFIGNKTSDGTGTTGNQLVVNGNYIGNNGLLHFNTALGDDSSATDSMIVNGNTSGTTNVSVDNAGGLGAKTLNGIELIQVNGQSDGDFVQSGRIVAGAYDYSLKRGAGLNATNWYLTSLSNLPVDPSIPGGTDEEDKRPEAGSYTANLASANNMFLTRLHDRLGETQYIDVLTGEQKVTSMWLRNEGGHNRSRDTSGQLKTQSNRYVMQLGGDIAQWSNNGLNRLHLGVMAGYGNSKSDTNARTGYKSTGSVDGYSTGVYSTWYANDEDKSGLYVDGWAQYSWFNNSVKGEGLATEEYKSKGITASVESGYTFKIGENKSKNESYFIQPKAQITWMGVKADEHREANGTQVSGQGDGNIQTRLGLRSYMLGHHESDNGKDREFQPFVEANWIHNTKDFGTNMNAVAVKQAGAKNIGELKLGVEGQLNKQLNVWGNVGQQLGDKGYSDTAVMLGVKYNF